MKKTLIIIFATITYFAYGRDTAFTIIGTVGDFEHFEREYVFMQRVIDNIWEGLDSAKIIDGKFTFTGSVETPTDARVVVFVNDPTTGNFRPPVQFILEGGTINVTANIDGTNTVTGTKYNDIRQHFLDVWASFAKKRNEAFAVSRQAEQDGNEELADFYRQEGVKLNSQMFDIMIEFIASNINNPAGLMQLNLSRGHLQLEQLQKILTDANEETLQFHGIVRLMERFEIAKRTAVGQPFVDLTMQDPDGNYISISDFVGNGYLMIDFTATWCGPCRAGKPAMIETFNRFNERGFNIIGVWFDTSHETWVSGMKALNMPNWPQMSDLEGWNSIGRRLYAVASIPHSVLIDPNGIIIARNLRGEDLNRKLEELLGK